MDPMHTIIDVWNPKSIKYVFESKKIWNLCEENGWWKKKQVTIFMKLSPETNIMLNMFIKYA